MLRHPCADHEENGRSQKVAASQRKNVVPAARTRTESFELPSSPPPPVAAREREKYQSAAVPRARTTSHLGSSTTSGPIPKGRRARHASANGSPDTPSSSNDDTPSPKARSAAPAPVGMPRGGLSHSDATLYTLPDRQTHYDIMSDFHDALVATELDRADSDFKVRSLLYRGDGERTVVFVFVWLLLMTALPCSTLIG